MTRPRRSYLIGEPCPASCPCRTASRDTPLADLVYGMGANSLRSLGEPAADGRSLSADLLAAFDALAAQNRAARAKRVAGGTVSIEGGGPAGCGVPGNLQYREDATPSDLDSPTPQSPPVRRKRRNKQEMAEARAAQAARIRESYHSLVPAEARAWLDEDDPMLARILSEPHDD